MSKWVFVPEEPTEEILKAMEWQIGGTPNNPVKTWGTTSAIYRAALAAAPSWLPSKVF